MLTLLIFSYSHVSAEELDITDPLAKIRRKTHTLFAISPNGKTCISFKYPMVHYLSDFLSDEYLETQGIPMSFLTDTEVISYESETGKVLKYDITNRKSTVIDILPEKLNLYHIDSEKFILVDGHVSPSIESSFYFFSKKNPAEIKKFRLPAKVFSGLSLPYFEFINRFSLIRLENEIVSDENTFTFFDPDLEKKYKVDFSLFKEYALSGWENNVLASENYLIRNHTSGGHTLRMIIHIPTGKIVDSITAGFDEKNIMIFNDKSIIFHSFNSYFIKKDIGKNVFDTLRMKTDNDTPLSPPFLAKHLRSIVKIHKDGKDLYGVIGEMIWLVDPDDFRLDNPAHPFNMHHQYPLTSFRTFENSLLITYEEPRGLLVKLKEQNNNILSEGYFCEFDLQDFLSDSTAIIRKDAGHNYPDEYYIYNFKNKKNIRKLDFNGLHVWSCKRLIDTNFFLISYSHADTEQGVFDMESGTLFPIKRSEEMMLGELSNTGRHGLPILPAVPYSINHFILREAFYYDIIENRRQGFISETYAVDPFDTFDLKNHTFFLFNSHSDENIIYGLTPGFLNENDVFTPYDTPFVIKYYKDSRTFESMPMPDISYNFYNSYSVFFSGTPFLAFKSFDYKSSSEFYQRIVSFYSLVSGEYIESFVMSPYNTVSKPQVFYNPAGLSTLVDYDEILFYRSDKGKRNYESKWKLETKGYIGPAELLYRNPDISDLNAYPNPVRDNMDISFKSDDEGTVTIVLADYTGKIIRRFEKAGNEGINTARINVSALPLGIYYISVSSKVGFQTFKFLKGE